MAVENGNAPDTKKQKLDLDGQEIEKQLAMVEAIEDSIHEIETRKAIEVLKVEKKYDLEQEPYYKKRAEVIVNLPNFWTTAFLAHPQLGTLVEEMDEPIFASLRSIDVEISKTPAPVGKNDVKKFDYRINFTFDENEFFENKVLSKSFWRLGDEALSENEQIKWKEGKKLVKEPKEIDEAGDVSVTEPESFFAWFSDHADANNDEVADTIKDDLYMNALSYYMNTVEEDDTKDEIDLEEEDDE